jgi:hypothetical protein
MPPRTVEAPGVRVGLRTIVTLALCAAAAGAAIAHYAIDVAGDYLLASDSYDHLRHGSRELLTGIALVAAAVLAARGLRVCCDIAARNRTRLLRPSLLPLETIGMLAGAVAASLDGVPVRHLSDAFGGSIALGIGITLLCTTLVALFVYGFARWLISHRDSVAAVIETLLRRSDERETPQTYDLIVRRVTFRRRAPHALRLAKRGPPQTSFA